MSGGGRRRKRRERVEGSSFMDVARQAYARHLALERWRDVEALREANGFDWPTAAAEMAEFPERWPYHQAWARRWREHVPVAAASGDPAVVFAAIEASVVAALADEDAARGERGDRPLDLDPGYLAFLDAALGKLATQAADTLERLDPHPGP